MCCAITLAPQVAPAESVSIGINGHYRVGRWTGVRHDLSSPITSIRTRDGDGVQVEYQQSRPIGGAMWGYVIPGSEAAPLILRDQERAVLSTRFPTAGSPSRGPAMIPLKMPWVLVAGDPLGVDQIGANKLLGRDPLIAVSRLQDASEFPDSFLGYDGVDMMMLGGPSAKLLAQLTDQQQQAITKWISGGGRLLLTLGQSAPGLLEAAPWLRALLPIEELGIHKIDPSALETYTSSQTPLQPFQGVKLPRDKGNILILGRTTRRFSTPVAVRYNVGFGRITVVTADLDNAMFAAWPERLDLITRLTGSILVVQHEQSETRNRATAYDDLAGQLRATLDQFTVKRSYDFSMIALILLALIAAIGPLDYLLINRVLGRPLLGWISFPLVAIGLAVLLVFQARPLDRGPSLQGQPASGDTTQCNRIEIFDLDATRGIGRGFAASYLYAHDAARLDLDVRQSESLTSICDRMEQVQVTPFGYPGESFGGIQIAIEDARLPIYQVRFSPNGLEADSPTGTSLSGLPLASRSSKGIATSCQFTPKLTPGVTVKHRPGSELLQGELINPLPLDLLDGMLVYRNWAYLLPTRFPAAGRIPSVEELRQKNFRWRLSRQRALESDRQTEDWDPAANDSPQRIAEMLMFHSAVGGARYTSLQNHPLSQLDLSHVLVEDRCILIGRVAQPLTQIRIKDENSSREISGDTLTVVRVVIPVTTPRRL